MIRSSVDVGAPALLLGPVRGLVTDAQAVRAELDAYRPEAVGTGLSPEELRGLVEYFGPVPSEPIVGLTQTELSEIRGLSRFGEVQVPNPAFVETLAWGRARSVPIVALDPGEEETAALFTEHIGYVELVRRTVHEHRLGRTPPTPSSADEFALSWDRTIAGGRGSRRFAAARDAHFAQGAHRLAGGLHRLAFVVDRERYASVRERLAAPDGR